MTMPGFTADASLLRAQSFRMMTMSGAHDRNGVVRPAARDACETLSQVALQAYRDHNIVLLIAIAHAMGVVC